MSVYRLAVREDQVTQFRAETGTQIVVTDLALRGDIEPVYLEKMAAER